MNYRHDCFILKSNVFFSWLTLFSETHRFWVDLVVEEVGILEVAEVWEYLSVLGLILLGLQFEHWRNEVGKAKKLSDDGISPGDQAQYGLSAQIIFSQEIHHGYWLNKENEKENEVEISILFLLVRLIFNVQQSSLSTTAAETHSGNSSGDFLPKGLLI